jgi:hypothetical protein
MKFFKPKQKTSAEVVSHNARARNFNKHLRIARATTGHEREVHLAKLDKLMKKYK